MTRHKIFFVSPDIRIERAIQQTWSHGTEDHKGFVVPKITWFHLSMLEFNLKRAVYLLLFSSIES